MYINQGRGVFTAGLGYTQVMVNTPHLSSYSAFYASIPPANHNFFICISSKHVLWALRGICIVACDIFFNGLVKFHYMLPWIRN